MGNHIRCATGKLFSSSERALMERGGNEPPKEAGLLVPPGAPDIGCLGDKVRPMRYIMHCW
jgi:hypothetical protein